MILYRCSYVPDVAWQNVNKICLMLFCAASELIVYNNVLIIAFILLLYLLLYTILNHVCFYFAQ